MQLCSRLCAVKRTGSVVKKRPNISHIFVWLVKRIHKFDSLSAYWQLLWVASASSTSWASHTCVYTVTGRPLKSSGLKPTRATWSPDAQGVMRFEFDSRYFNEEAQCMDTWARRTRIGGMKRMRIVAAYVSRDWVAEDLYWRSLQPGDASPSTSNWNKKKLKQVERFVERNLLVGDLPAAS